MLKRPSNVGTIKKLVEYEVVGFYTYFEDGYDEGERCSHCGEYTSLCNKCGEFIEENTEDVGICMGYGQGHFHIDCFINEMIK